MENIKELFNLNEHLLRVENINLHLYRHIMASSKKLPEAPFKASILHIHPYYEIFACTEGCIDLTCNGESINVRRGEILIMPPSFMHTMKTYGQAGKCLTLGMACERCDGDYNFDLWHRYLHIFKENRPVKYRISAELFLSFCAVSEKTQGTAQFVQLIDFLPFLDGISGLRPEYPLALPDHRGISDEKARDKDINRIAVMDHIVNSCYTMDIDLNDIADMMFVSIRQLHRIAKSRYGVSIREIINKKRNELSLGLLLHTDNTIESIAAASGYPSKETYIRNFTKEYGTSPAEYRRRGCGES